MPLCCPGRQASDNYNNLWNITIRGGGETTTFHFGTAREVRAQRAVVLEAAYGAHAEQFAKPPAPPRLPTAAWVNQPSREVLIQTRR